MTFTCCAQASSSILPKRNSFSFFCCSKARTKRGQHPRVQPSKHRDATGLKPTQPKKGQPDPRQGRKEATRQRGAQPRYHETKRSETPRWTKVPITEKVETSGRQVYPTKSRRPVNPTQTKGNQKPQHEFVFLPYFFSYKPTSPFRDADQPTAQIDRHLVKLVFDLPRIQIFDSNTEQNHPDPAHLEVQEVRSPRSP